MGLTVTTPASNLRLCTVSALKADLGDATSTNDTLYDAMVLRASAAIDGYCHRTFARQVYTEVLPGRGGCIMRLAEAPVAAVTSITFDGASITDYSIDRPAAGLLYRQIGWGWSVQLDPGLGQWGVGYPLTGVPVNGSEVRYYSIVYTSGFLLPSQDVTSATAVSADSADNSFNHSGAGFPALLKAGDIIETLGFSTAANNGRHVVTGTPTTSKVVVGSTLTTEAGNTGTHYVYFSTLPKDIEAAALTTAKAYWGARKNSGDVVEKQLGAARLRFSEGGGGSLPSLAAALLAPYVRSA